MTRRGGILTAVLLALALVLGACSSSDDEAQMRPRATATRRRPLPATTATARRPCPTTSSTTPATSTRTVRTGCAIPTTPTRTCVSATSPQPSSHPTARPRSRSTPADDPPIDCFYVYPTVSSDPGVTSDLEAQEGDEIRAVVNQAARLSSVCEVYAPVYRQMTLASLLQRIGGADDEDADGDAMAAARATTYGDVLDAWNHYLANHNDGRGVILVGHSQGSGLLTQLVAEEIDGEPALRDRLVSAWLLGSTVPVPEGEDVGGAFEEIPACRSPDQIGCVVAYASFPASDPPGDDAIFGRTADEDTVAICTNPGALDGGTAELTPYFTAEQGAALAPDLDITTPWVSVRGVINGECVTHGDHHVLELTVGGDPTNTRDQELRGGLPRPGAPTSPTPTSPWASSSPSPRPRPRSTPAADRIRSSTRANGFGTVTPTRGRGVPVGWPFGRICHEAHVVRTRGGARHGRPVGRSGGCRHPPARDRGDRLVQHRDR
ncbi:MAG: DUF3089 domain-containing protein [Acidimicrobiia bacterium]|nr:DUF3089 domain-containing protein [Acidimicrobiia bacterium]